MTKAEHEARAEAEAKARAMTAYRAAVRAGRLCACEGPHLAYCPMAHPEKYG